MKHLLRKWSIHSMYLAHNVCGSIRNDTLIGGQSDEQVGNSAVNLYTSEGLNEWTDNQFRQNRIRQSLIDICKETGEVMSEYVMKCRRGNIQQ